MKKKKIKIFLAGYANYTNAQNINCRSLAKYLDRDKFECGFMLYPEGDLSLDSTMKNIRFFRCLRPTRYGRYINYLKGIMWCDVAYLPKGEIWRFCSKILRLFGKKSFITVEIVVSGSQLERALASIGTHKQIAESYNYTTKTYSITKYMAKKNNELLGIRSDGVLYLGIDTEEFKPQLRQKESLRNIVFIGNNIRYKGIDDFYIIAEKFPELTFHIVGGGLGYDVAFEIEKRELKNCVYHGLMNHEKLSKLLLDMDLHIFPSRSEGFPKVTLETAAMGVPSVVYGDYGADEWISSEKNGFVVNTIDEIESIVRELLENPEKLNILSVNAVELSRLFDWRRVIKTWEREIEELIQ